MVFENQVDGFERLKQDYRDHPEKIPADLRDDLARDLVRRYFAGSTQDPLPRGSTFHAPDPWRNALAAEPYTFKEKQEFDPARLAHDIREKNLGVQDQDAIVRSIWKSNRACQLCYRDDISSFFADIYVN